jgi:hypothetical protein
MWEIEMADKGAIGETNKFLDSIEVAKVLSMDIPVALVVELPKREIISIGPTVSDFSDIILCFPCFSCVHAYLYSVRDGEYRFKDLGKYGDGEKYSERKDKMVKEYKYVVSLRPFLIDIKNKTGIAKFRIQVSNVGFDVVEITIFIDDDHREREWISVDYYEGANESDYWEGKRKQHIAKLVRKDTQNGFVWEPIEKKPEIEELPFIRGYM